MSDQVNFENATCPLPMPHREQIVLGHGSGGKMTHDLIHRVFLPRFSNPIINSGDDAACISNLESSRLSISTDSHVVWPLFFPGGDIGRLAICGTVNDVAMLGADPKYITVGFILEEGLETSILEKVLNSMKQASEEACIKVITGDTKVVQKGKADGLYITTCGIGFIPDDINIGGSKAIPGDQIILSGPIGNHGIAVIEARGELGFSSGIQSDVAPLNHLVSAILKTSKNIHVLRDPTRGGLATTLVEIAQQSGVCIKVDESLIPVNSEVSIVCEILGYDPLFIANEGVMVVIAPKEDSDMILATMKKNRYGEEAVVIGEILPSPAKKVLLKTPIGTSRIIDMLTGEMLPRIC